MIGLVMHASMVIELPSLHSVVVLVRPAHLVLLVTVLSHVIIIAAKWSSVSLVEIIHLGSAALHVVHTLVASVTAHMATTSTAKLAVVVTLVLVAERRHSTTICID